MKMSRYSIIVLTLTIICNSCVEAKWKWPFNLFRKKTSQQPTQLPPTRSTKPTDFPTDKKSHVLPSTFTQDTLGTRKPPTPTDNLISQLRAIHKNTAAVIQEADKQYQYIKKTSHGHLGNHQEEIKPFLALSRNIRLLERTFEETVKEKRAIYDSLLPAQKKQIAKLWEEIQTGRIKVETVEWLSRMIIQKKRLLKQPSQAYDIIKILTSGTPERNQGRTQPGFRDWITQGINKTETDLESAKVFAKKPYATAETKIMAAQIAVMAAQLKITAYETERIARKIWKPMGVRAVQNERWKADLPRLLERAKKKLSYAQKSLQKQLIIPKTTNIPLDK